MKILICAHEYYPKGSGIANVVYNVKKEMEKQPQEVTVLSTSEADINVGHEKTINKIGGIGIYLFWKKAFEYILRNHKKYDVIWLHNPLFTHKLKKIKTFCTVHTTFAEYSKLYSKFYPRNKLRFYYKAMSLIERIAYRKIGKQHEFTITSNKTSEELKNLGVRKKARLISNGVDIDMFRPAKDKKQIREELRLPLDKNILLFVGRIEDQKKPLLMIKTVHNLNKTRDDLLLVIVGDGPLKTRVEDYCEQLNVKNVMFTGKLSYDKVKEYYSASDYFFMTSIYEGQPLSLLEALGSGLVPILSDIPIFKDMVKAAGSGVAISFNSSAKAAEQISDFMKRTDLKKESSKIRKFSEKNISWKHIAELYVAFFKEKIRK